MVNTSRKSPRLTLGVITHDRSTLFSNLLLHLKIASRNFHADRLESSKRSLLVIKNSSERSYAAVQQIVNESTIDEVCAESMIDTPKNNNAIGRNLNPENTPTQWLVFVDDDEYSLPEWVSGLCERQQGSGSSVVAGPVEPVYAAGTASCLAAVDLHYRGRLKTGDKLRRVATGNCLLDLQQISSQRVATEFGSPGGSDSLFFDQLAERGLQVVWREDAIVHENIPVSRTSSRYRTFRCMTQGQHIKGVVLRNAAFPQQLVVMLKAGFFAPLSLIFGALAVTISSRVSGYWLKRGLIDLGKLIRPSTRLHG